MTTCRPLRELEHRAILGDDDVEAGQVSGDAMEIGQPASRDQNDHDAALARLTDRLADSRIEDAVDGDRAVVVERKGREFHGFEISYAPFLASDGRRCRFSGTAPSRSFLGRSEIPFVDATLVLQLPCSFIACWSAGARNYLTSAPARTILDMNAGANMARETESAQTTPVRVPIGD